MDREDLEFIFTQFSDDDINKYLFDADPLKDISEANDIIEFYLKPEPRPQHRWIVIRKVDGVKMGTCGFHCWSIENSKVEIGYDLKKEFWGNGYMFEALKGIIEFAKNSTDLKEINACIYTKNQKSINLAKKLGFVRTGSKYEIFRGENTFIVYIL
ncbi:GNAT family N-acetyltransferase [Anaerobacillus sp. CMMVII]|uniref:GNAT family N-acetyltransferase n=1 Tax=Anaerobacillus sp. CMMVII TaxID=2755588 RepID=UPI0021B76A4C|nr:GNAT family N-acetyltransferase [Anaerobacillus sp. CMMVII]